VGPRAGLDVCEKPRPHRDSNPGPSSPWSVAIPTELPGPLSFMYVTVKKTVANSEFIISLIQLLYGAL
jgi:hypothetical protein